MPFTLATTDPMSWYCPDEAPGALAGTASPAVADVRVVGFVAGSVAGETRG
jgi:hypothetical protein